MIWKDNISFDFIASWANIEGTANSTSEICQWIDDINTKNTISIQKCSLNDASDWYYDSITGEISHVKHSFFKICGLQYFDDHKLVLEQPIIIQNEIGYLGIICKKINGVLNFLMQAKIEPGNINKVQISPTIQATKSNFTQKHGGKKPAYLSYFQNVDVHHVIYDQLQSEPASRFYKKRNRNIIILVDDEIPTSPNHKWMTLGQIKALMKIDNLVNSCTRSVISCIPYTISNKSSLRFPPELKLSFSSTAMFQSIFGEQDDSSISQIYQYLNMYKMLDETEIKLIPLFSLRDWKLVDSAFINSLNSDFKVIFCDIEISGREVSRWTQPLIEALTPSTFGLIMCDVNGVKKFLVHATPEPGCFDKLELGPSVQIGQSSYLNNNEHILSLFFQQISEVPSSIKYDVVLSEEGGRFFHEQNRNIILQLEPELLSTLPDGYFLVDYRTLNLMIQINNCLNIQLRNLLSMLEV